MLEGKLLVASDESLRKIEAAAFRLLEQLGMRVPTDVLLDCLEDYGADVDPDKARMIHQVVERARRELAYD